MKIRNGFVSNSSSSSFIIGSNDRIEDTMKKNFSKWFPATDERTKDFIQRIANELGWEIGMWDSNSESFETWKDFVKHEERNMYSGYEMSEDTIKKYKPFFEKWKYVHIIDIPSDGDGGTRLSQALRYTFPREFENEDCEVKIECEG